MSDFTLPADYLDTYRAECVRATTRQGLDPVVAVLDAAGVPVEVEQTGGMMMVATVRVAGGTYGITSDSDDPADDPSWLVAWYPGASWLMGGEECGVREQQDLPQVLALVMGQDGIA